ncbi:hypothetical protein Tco_1433263 [Tanacetum coccineum]
MDEVPVGIKQTRGMNFKSQGYAVTNLGLRRYGNSYAVTGIKLRHNYLGYDATIIALHRNNLLTTLLQEVFDTIAPFNFYNFNLQDDRRFVSQAWNRLFRIKEQVVREYVMEFLSSFTFRDHIKELEEADNWWEKEEYDYETVHLGSWHSGKEKVTLDDLFLLHSMDGGVSVDVLCHVAKFLSDKAKGSKRKSPIVRAYLIGKISSYYGLMTLGALMNVTLGPETSSISVAKLVDLGICRYNGLGIGEIVAEIPEVARDDVVRAGQAEIGGVGRHPNMSNANRLRVMDGMLGEIVNDVDKLTYVLLAHHHIDHTRYDGTYYSYVPSIPDLGVQQGVNFMSVTPGYSTAPSPSASQFGMFGDAYPSTSRNQDDMNED